MRGSRVFLYASVLILLLSGPPMLSAQVEFGGFIQTNHSVRTTGATSRLGIAGDFPLGEERLQLRLEGYSEDGSTAFAGKVDIFHDAVLSEPGTEVREAYVDLVSESITFRAGRQIVTWGIGDLLFINDIFPKDWVAFFTGRPLQYLKIGSDALKIGLYTTSLAAEVVAVPFFQSDRYPTGDRLVLADPLLQKIPRIVEVKERSLENAEISVRASRYFADWEVAAYVSRTFYRSPAIGLDDPTAPTEARLFFPRLNIYGGSSSGGVLGGVLALEGAYCDSEDDREGTDAAIENSQVKGLVGYSYPLWGDATVGLQGFLEWMLDRDSYRASLPAGLPERDELRWTATTRFTQLLLHQTLTTSVFVLWGIAEQDAYLIPSVRYSFTDALWAELGGNVFFGTDDYTMFGALDRNDNVYLTIRHGF